MKYATQIGAGNVELFRLLRANCQINRVEVLSQARQRNIAPDGHATSDRYTAPTQQVEAAIDDPLLEFERRNAVDEQTAGTRLCFKNCDGVTELRQFIRASHSARTAANHSDLESVRRSNCRIEFLMRERVFIDELFDRTD